MEKILLKAFPNNRKDKKVTGNSQHGFTKEKSHLINQTNFYNATTGLLGEGWERVVVYLNVNNAFDSISNILITKFTKYGLGKQTVRWFKYWLNGQG